MTQNLAMTHLINWYQEQINNNKLKPDHAQQKIFEDLQSFLDLFAKQNFITRIFNKDKKLGYYIYGDVGRGKSMIMNAMYQATENPKKLRIHFHEFMRDIHNQLAQSKQDEPLKHIAKRLKKHYDIIYLDEMHVSDITTAMIMKNLLEQLFYNNIYIVTSSNYHPDKLWPNGLMRERFLPAIETIKTWLNISSLNSNQDYRLLNNSFNNLFIINNTEANLELENIFTRITANNSVYTNEITICGRKLPTIKYSTKCLWVDFWVICGNMRSQLDYIQISQQFNWIIISNLVALNSEQKDIARRFTWLVDILYDTNCKLAIESSVAIDKIYLDGDFAHEFIRTISRLEEMQTNEYLQKS